MSGFWLVETRDMLMVLTVKEERETKEDQSPPPPGPLSFVALGVGTDVTDEGEACAGGIMRLAGAVRASQALTLSSWSHSEPEQLDMPRVRAPTGSPSPRL